MRAIRGGVLSPGGFSASALNCGIKKRGRDDLALLFSEFPAFCAATFTTNRIRSGSVTVSEKAAKKGIAQAVIVNSGNANCCVGESEIKDAGRMIALAAEGLGVNKELILVGSTGIIGKPLPITKIASKIKQLVKNLDYKSGTKFARAIMTTDTVAKETAVKIPIGGNLITIGGAVKGSGMIHPDMATMLAFFTTDACVDKTALRDAFKEAVRDSFNRITVDGDTSTNDSAFILANGFAGNKIIRKNSITYVKFLDALKTVAKNLAKKIVLDGEGATKFVEVTVKNANTEKTADKIARRIANSNLVKTMIAGGDPNWGRVAASAGSAGAGVKQGKLDIYFGKKQVMERGRGTVKNHKTLRGMFKRKEIEITVDVNSGKKSATVWTCDFTEDYVRINAEYET